MVNERELQVVLRTLESVYTLRIHSLEEKTKALPSYKAVVAGEEYGTAQVNGSGNRILGRFRSLFSKRKLSE
jgi:hypothetical protein